MTPLHRRAALSALLASAALTACPAFAQTVPAADAPAAAGRLPDRQAISSSPRPSAPKACRTCRSRSGADTKKLDELNITNFYAICPACCRRCRSRRWRYAGHHVVYMRGVASGGDGNHSGSLPSVGVYLDEQPVTTIGGNLDVHIYDIARIESLVRAAGHAVRRVVRSRHDPHHHQQARHVELVRPRSTARGTASQGRLSAARSEGMINMPLSAGIAFRVRRLSTSATPVISTMCRARAVSTCRPRSRRSRRATPARSTTLPSSRRTITTPRSPAAAPR